MPCLEKLRAILVINEPEDDEEDLAENGSDTADSPRGARPTKQELADMSDIERRQEAQEQLKYKKEPTCCEKACFDWKPRICYVICIIIFLGIILPFILIQAVFRDEMPKRTTHTSCFIELTYRFPCYIQDKGVLNRTQCEEVDCCYDERYVVFDQFAPLCYHSLPSLYGYKLDTLGGRQVETRKKPIAPLKASRILDVKSEVNGTLKRIKDKTPYNTTAYDLEFKVVDVGNNAIRIQIGKEGTLPNVINHEVADNPIIQAHITEDTEHNFAITVNRTETNETIFKTIGPLIFGDKYIEMATQLPTRYLYGLGQKSAYVNDPDFDKWEEWMLFSTEGTNSDIRYGSHPFYMCFEESNMVHGVFLRHSGPLNIKVLPTPAVTFRLLAGYIDITIMAGPEPRDVSKQYAQQVGFPALPPYWALGFHLCRTARNTSLYSNVSEMMDNHKIPYESDCIDAQLNYPDAFKSLTNDTIAQIRELKNKSRKFIMVQYPFVATENIDVYDAEYMLNFGNDNPYYGLVNGSVVGYPDYGNSNTYNKLLNNNSIINELYAMADGFMLLQNTPLNEAAVNYTEFNETLCSVDAPELCCGPNDANIYPSLPRFMERQDLSEGTVCMDVKQKEPTGGNGTVPHLPYHNAYGHYHMKSIYQFLREHVNTTHRPMITSLSTKPGSSQFGGHFGGSYEPNFPKATKGLIQVLKLGLAGIPFTGTPICGSIDESSEGGLQADVCLRAYQMNSFFPFMMSYTELGSELRDPTAFPDKAIMYLRLVIIQRYMLLPYLYTLQWEASTSGVPPVRLLAYEFPQHLGSRQKPQFMVGSSLMVTPVLNSIINMTSVEVDVLFPPGCWYDYHTGAMVSNSVDGKNLTLSSLLTDINLHVQGGHIVPMQGSTASTETTTEGFRKLPYKLLVALSCNPPHLPPDDADLTTEMPQIWNATAQGSLYLDDGALQKESYEFFQGLEMSVVNNILTVNTTGNPCDDKYNHTIESIFIMGADPIAKIWVGGTPINDTDFTQDTDSGRVDIKVTYDWCNPTKSLEIKWE